MAQPEKNPAAMASVKSCAATDCAHNEDRSCTASQVTVVLEAGRPSCGTYEPSAPSARP
ncbi:DUF1540 domain-containing protein [Gaopeijia maritima]|uniref:DUF1540 domain-containing protein n=2 Tax=Gaopeijia maritima TaxID=3119007 RepID=A0ABU9EE70_9BACT